MYNVYLAKEQEQTLIGTAEIGPSYEFERIKNGDGSYKVTNGKPVPLTVTFGKESMINVLVQKTLVKNFDLVVTGSNFIAHCKDCTLKHLDFSKYGKVIADITFSSAMAK